jgi:putative tryptophan/tyrosine transport system substrate-binding protein
MRRRELIALFAGVAAACGPLAAAAQQPRIPTIGILVAETLGANQFQRQFRDALRALGYVEGQTIRFESRSDQGQSARLPALAAELVQLKVDVIVTWLTPAARAAKQATQNIPIVIALAGNSVETGLVESLARPGGNITGLAGVGGELAGKTVELIHQMLPSAHRVAALVNAPDPFSKPFLDNIRLGGKATGISIDPIMLSGADDLEAAFARMENDRPDAAVVQPTLGLKRSAELALKHLLPAVSIFREFVDEGGLMSYSVVEADVYRRTAVFVDKILKGAKPADLPVEQPTKFELVINLKTAKAIGITVPQPVVQQADEVIE